LNKSNLHPYRLKVKELRYISQLGKKTSCAKHNDPGHDPQFRLTRRVSGKTVTESFPNPTALRKAQQDVAEFHRFRKLSQKLLAVNERSVDSAR